MVWWFFVPKVAFGENALVELEAIRGSKAFIVTDSVVNSRGFPERISEILRRRNWEVAIWDCAEEDPRVSIVKSAAKAIDRFAPDWIIAVGGGSVIDTAKAAWILHEHPDTDLEAVNPIEPLNLRYKAKLACVPTTAGTGSEATKDIVIRDDESGRKFGTINNEIVPDLAILEPEFVKGLPKNLTAYTGLDALTHAVEAYTSVWKNDYSDACSLKAVQMIFNWLPKSVENPEDLEAREKMLIAANLAGMSFSNAQVSLAHSIGHALGSVFRYQHGMAVGIALPYTIDYNYRDNPDCAKKYWELAMMIGILEKDHSKASKIFADKIRELKSKIGVPNNLKEAGTSKEDLEKGLDNLVKYTIMDTSLSMNPRGIDGDTIEKIYTYMYEGKLIDF